MQRRMVCAVQHILFVVLYNC